MLTLAIPTYWLFWQRLPKPNGYAYFNQLFTYPGLPYQMAIFLFTPGEPAGLCVMLAAEETGSKMADTQGAKDDPVR